MTFLAPHLITLAEAVLQAAREKKLWIATAESCTGGLIAACLTEVAGSSDVFERGFIVYSNDAKMTELNVSYKTIAAFGAVSPEVALEMAEGALHSSSADITVSATGIAGPGGGSDAKPVGTVFIGLSSRKNDKSIVLQNKYEGNRTDIRLQTVETALLALQKEITGL